MLATDALCGVAVLADGPTTPLAAALARAGATARRDDEPVDLVLIGVDGRAELPEVACGDAAAALAMAFRSARNGARALSGGGQLLFVVYGSDPSADGIAALTRTLALEWAPAGLRVNAIVCRRPEEAAELVGFVAASASRMLTGAVLVAA